MLLVNPTRILTRLAFLGWMMAAPLMAANLDAMARNRYNVLSLWSLHPFPSMAKVPEYPEVALDDVWRTRVKLDDQFSMAGNDMVRPAMLADHEVVKRIKIDEKIEFGRWVMQQAADHDASLHHLEDALTHWKKYATIRDAHYIPAMYNRVGFVDVTALTDKVAVDIDIARNWKPGALQDDGKRAGIGKNFQK